MRRSNENNNYEKLKLELDRLVYEGQNERDAHNSAKNKIKMLEEKISSAEMNEDHQFYKFNEKVKQIEILENKLTKNENENTKLTRDNNRLQKLMNECNKNIKSMTKYGSSFKIIDEQLNSYRSKANTSPNMTPSKENPTFMLNSTNDGRMDIDLLEDTNKDNKNNYNELSKLNLGNN